MTQSPPTGELVARLRKRANGWISTIVAASPGIYTASDDAWLAAEAITTLERELEESRAKEHRVDALAAIAEIREVTGLGAKPMLSELAGAVQVLLSKYAHAADTAKAERDASQAEVERLKALVETAFRDGLTYGTNVVVTDADEAWRTSRVRAALQVEESKG